MSGQGNGFAVIILLAGGVASVVGIVHVLDADKPCTPLQEGQRATVNGGKGAAARSFHSFHHTPP
jgi:hypothetical protein